MTGGAGIESLQEHKVVSKLSAMDFKTLDKVQGFRNLGSRLKAVTTEVDEKQRHRKMEKFLRDLVNATSPADSDCVVEKVERPAPGKHSAVGSRIKTGDVFHYRHFFEHICP